MSNVNTQLTESFLRLSTEEQQQLFQLLVDNIDLFEKLLPPSPLIAHIKGTTQLDHPIAEAYNLWKTLNAKT